MRKKYEYTLEDCACEYCLHYNAKKRKCKHEKCCCLKEKRIALARLRAGKPGSEKWAG